MMTGFEQRYKSLNNAQKQAVDTIEGPVLVVAGPGSGKTELLSLRVANILKQTDTAPGSILCLTFTESAASNMRERLAGLIGRDAYRVSIHTFHSFGVEIRNRYQEYFHKGATFFPADELTKLEVLGTIFDTLPHDSPLSSKDYEGNFVYLKDTSTALSNIKKGGLTPSELGSILKHNEAVLEAFAVPIAEIFEERISKKVYGEVEELIQKIRAWNGPAVPVSHMRSLHTVMADSLESALRSCEETGKSTPLSDWKKKWIEKNDEKKSVLREVKRLEKMVALADLYEKYREQMLRLGYYDYEDMLLDVVHALESSPALKYELQEEFQYTLVDEFQDTNDVQMRILLLLADAPVNEGRPNMLAVGDDDQAIYRFQGAEISNILDFKSVFRDPELVVLTDNYRSTQGILDLARDIVVKGEDRLENRLPELEKKLVSSNPEMSKGSIVHEVFQTPLEEYKWVSEEVKRLIENGCEPKNIAVIAKKHSVLKDAITYMHGAGVPAMYERKQNVFDEPHIRELLALARFAVLLLEKRSDNADALLPEILSFPFWGLERRTIWGISLRAEKSGVYRGSLLKAMLDHEEKIVRDIAGFLLEISSLAQYGELETVLDCIIGTENDTKSTKKTYTSPFRSYYFSRDKFEHRKAEYLTFLSGLRVLMGALREYRGGRPLKLADFVTFADTHVKLGRTLSDTSPFVSSKNAVNMLTAHGAKGLEFETVFVLSCADKVWASPGKSSNLTFPANLTLAPSRDTHDDYLRLFYVALTRAKRHLYLTSYVEDASGKTAPPLRFLVDEGQATHQSEHGKPREDAGNPADILDQSWRALTSPPYVGDEFAMLETLVENYQMSPTHLNNFLDVSRGGPQVFLEQNLLRFPQAKSPSGVYGSAMHGAIQSLYASLKRDEKLPTLKSFNADFETLLRSGRLSENETNKYLKQGTDALTVYYEQNKKNFDPDHKIEVDFKSEGVLIGDAHVTGKIDKLVKDGSEMTVYDFKTGKVLPDWKTSNPFSKVKLYRFRQQLIFYKLLVENSKRYGAYNVPQGVIEYLEPKGDKANKKMIMLPLEFNIEEVERTKQLIEAVYKKIITLDFPEVDAYSKDVKGIEAFEDDLLS